MFLSLKSLYFYFTEYYEHKASGSYSDKVSNFHIITQVNKKINWRYEHCLVRNTCPKSENHTF